MVEFFEEVEEQLRSDRYRAIVQKAWPWAAGVLAAVLVGTIGFWTFDTYAKATAAKASDAYGAGLDSLQKGELIDAYEKFGVAAKSPAKAYASLALMMQGGIRARTGKTAEAVTLFDHAAQVAPSPVIGDAARLQAVYALMDTAPYSQIDTRLKPLLADGRPYRIQAREVSAMAKLAAGQTVAARQDFKLLSVLQDAPPIIRERAGAAVALIDSGTAQVFPALIKATLIAPPPPPPPAQPQAGDPSLSAPATPQGAAQ